MGAHASQRNISILLFASVVAFLLIFFVIPANAHAAAGKKTLLNCENQVGKISTTTIDKYDITNDGQKDLLSIQVGNRFHNSYENIYFYINGQLCYKSELLFTCKVQLLTLKSGKKFIYFVSRGGSDDGYYNVLQYKGGKLKTVLNQYISKGIRHAWITKLKVSGNYVRVTFGNSPYATGYIKCTYNYKYKKGTLKRTKYTPKAVKYYIRGKRGYTPTTGYITTACKLKVYKSASKKSKKSYLKKGTKVKIVAIKIKKKTMWFKLKPKSGKARWLKNPRKGIAYGKGHASTYFEETCQVG